MNTFKKTGGFTLVELIVVIAILAILSAVSVAGYSAYIQKANDSVVKSQLTELGTAIAAADAVNAAIDTVETEDGETFTVTLKTDVTAVGTDFATDLAAFYPGASYDKNSHKITLTTKIDFSNSSITKATWSSTGWEFVTE